MSSEVDAFVRFASLLTVEDGSPLVIEDWQRDVTDDVFKFHESLVLLPKSNGKTALLAALALYHMVSTPDARVYVAAASRDQASLLYGYAQGYIKRSPELQTRLIARAGYREIRSRKDLGYLKVLASDADTADGVGPTLALVDELHRHKDGSLYAALRDGLGKRDGHLVTISTAGWDEYSALGKLRRAALGLPNLERHGAHIRASSKDFVMHEWAVPEGADTSDLSTVKQANPSSFVTLQALAVRRDSPSMRESDWLRFACNIWTASENPWLPDGAWAALARPGETIEAGTEIVCGFDGSFSSDSTALIACTRGEEPFVAVLGIWENRALDPAWRAPRLEIMQAIRNACSTYKCIEVAVDPAIWVSDLEQLMDEGLPIVTFTQKGQGMIAAQQRLFEAVSAGRLHHDGNPDLARHIGQVVQKADGRLAKDSPHSKRWIDAAIACVMAFERAASAEPPEPEVRGGLITFCQCGHAYDTNRPETYKTHDASKCFPRPGAW